MKGLLTYIAVFVLISSFSSTRRYIIDSDDINELTVIKSLYLENTRDGKIKIYYKTNNPIALINNSYLLLENNKLIKTGIDNNNIFKVFSRGTISYDKLIDIVRDIQSNKNLSAQIKEMRFHKKGILYSFEVITKTGMPIYMGDINSYNRKTLKRLTWLLNNNTLFDGRCEYVKLYFENKVVYKLKNGEKEAF